MKVKNEGFPKRFGRKRVKLTGTGATPMSAKAVKIPGPDHPIAVTPNPKRITVSVSGKIIATTTHALTL
jgi:hypothetical protein